MTFTGYYQRPTLMGETLVFVYEDDLWLTELKKGAVTAYRLTANPGRANDPQLCPDGQHLAFTSLDEGHPEVFVTRLDEMEPQRLTYLGEDTRCVGWTRDGSEVLFATNAGNPFSRIFKLASVHRDGGPASRLGLGPAAHVSYAPKKGRVIGRHTWDPARWKRYRGGTAGQLWIDPKEDGQFHQLLELNGNLTRPLWVGDRIYFGSDHEGICNLYSCNRQGKGLRQHTFHKDFYIRYPNTDGKRIVYQCGGDIYLFDPSAKKPKKLDITVHTPRPRLARKFVSPGRYLESYALNPTGSHCALGVRGRPFTMAHWEGAVQQHGERDGVRYRRVSWGEQGLICVNDSKGEEEIGLFMLASKEEQERLGAPFGVEPEYRSLTEGHDIGRVLDLGLSPCGDKVWFSNHRHELFALSFPRAEEPEEKKKAKGKKSKKKAKPLPPPAPELVLVTSDPYRRIGGACWSPDGEWLAYSRAINRQDSQIEIWSWETRESQAVTTPAFYDWGPDFDPDGRYLYFLSCRDFDPVRDNMFFEHSFPKAARPYVITLQKEQPDPFLDRPRPPGDDPPALPSPYVEEEKKDGESEESSKTSDADEGKDSKEKADAEAKAKAEEAKKPKKIRIDFEGIQHRVRVFPVDEGRYWGVMGLKGKVLLGLSPVKPNLGTASTPSEGPSGMVGVYDLKKLEMAWPLKAVSGFDASADRSTVIYRSGSSLRVLKAAAVASAPSERTAGRTSGWLDLGRVKVSVKPAPEWGQMLAEAWRLMRDHFWDKKMANVDWEGMLKRYQPLLARLSTRREFSDLLWEFQGELGTSHAYEYGGDYRHGPHYAQGKLAATVEWLEKESAYRVVEIAQGDPWSSKHNSPLRVLHHPLEPGDLLLAVNGNPLDRANPPEKFLVNQADQNVTLTVLRKKSKREKGKPEPELVTVKALRRETPVRYRDWVESNRAYVHKKSKGRLGYIHIPNMSALGYSEFHRGYYSEVERDGLVIDVRYNGGGNVSQLLLEKLARKRLGFDVQRWGAPIPYPQESPAGPLVALTNEQAGSDGDIFSHCFKLMGLGPLLGKRTWGGTIGIWPRHPLVDGTVTTQPEFAFWFTDVGWSVENYGTDPDEVVEIRPQDWSKGKDPQLDRAVQVGIKLLKTHPPLNPDAIPR